MTEPKGIALLGEFGSIRAVVTSKIRPPVKCCVPDSRSIPGDPLGDLKCSFLLAEISGDLECVSASNEIIKALNLSFRDYRESDPEQHGAAKQLLFQHLESAGERYPDLLSKVVDFQAQVDELERNGESAGNVDDDIDSDFPF